MCLKRFWLCGYTRLYPVIGLYVCEVGLGLDPMDALAYCVRIESP